jgi:hypothetical protein
MRPSIPGERDDAREDFQSLEAVTIPIDPLLLRVGALLSRADVEWAAAGGWAIDLFLGRVTRPHHDVDLAMWRDQQRAVRIALPDWEFSIADSGLLRPWRHDEQIDLPLHELHARGPDGRSVEFLLNDRARGAWIYRRDERIGLPITRAIRHAAAAPFLVPEIVLLYKSKSPRAIDNEDFRSAAPHLSLDARAWLADALARNHRSHPWLEHLREGDA